MNCKNTWSWFEQGWLQGFESFVSLSAMLVGSYFYAMLTCFLSAFGDFAILLQRGTWYNMAFLRATDCSAGESEWCVLGICEVVVVGMGYVVFSFLAWWCMIFKFILASFWIARISYVVMADEMTDWDIAEAKTSVARELQWCVMMGWGSYFAHGTFWFAFLSFVVPGHVHVYAIFFVFHGFVNILWRVGRWLVIALWL